MAFLLHIIRAPNDYHSAREWIYRSRALCLPDGALRDRELREAREAGAVFENLLLVHPQAFTDLLLPIGRLYYWSTVSGVEVDFVLEWGRKLVAFETKLSRNPRYRDTKGSGRSWQSTPTAARASSPTAEKKSYALASAS